MSKYKRIQTQLKDRDALLAALAALEIPHEVAAPGEALALYGYEGKRRAETAEIAVRRAHIGHAANDLGFAWNEAEGRFDAIVSEYDNTDARGHALHTLNQIKQQYAVEQVTALAELQGYTVEPVEAAGGVVRLQLVRW